MPLNLSPLQYCIDLSDWGALREDQTCMCDVSRFLDAQPHASDAWAHEVPWVILGVGLAALGMSFLALNQSAHLSRTKAERARSKLLSMETNTFNNLAAGTAGHSTAASPTSSPPPHVKLVAAKYKV